MRCEGFALPWPLSDDERTVANALCFVPEGHRRKLAGGKPAQRARPPGLRGQTCHAPAGHRRSSWRRFPRSFFATARRRRPFSSMPRWGMEPGGSGSGGGVRWGGLAPRLISSGVPPGREPGVPARSGYSFAEMRGKSKESSDGAAATGDRPCSAVAAASPRSNALGKFSRAVRILRGGRVCARRPSRSGLGAGDAADFNGPCEVSGPLRQVLGGHNRAPWIAASPLIFYVPLARRGAGARTRTCSLRTQPARRVSSRIWSQPSFSSSTSSSKPSRRVKALWDSSSGP